MHIKEVAEKHSEWVNKQDWQKTTVLEKLALIGSEVGEAVNECRGNAPTEEFPHEIADIVLRVFHLAETENIDIEEAVKRKIKKNKKKDIDKSKLK